MQRPVPSNALRGVIPTLTSRSIFAAADVRQFELHGNTCGFRQIRGSPEWLQDDFIRVQEQRLWEGYA